MFAGIGKEIVVFIEIGQRGNGPVEWRVVGTDYAIDVCAPKWQAVVAVGVRDGNITTVADDCVRQRFCGNVR